MNTQDSYSREILTHVRHAAEVENERSLRVFLCYIIHLYAGQVCVRGICVAEDKCETLP